MKELAIKKIDFHNHYFPRSYLKVLQNSEASALFGYRLSVNRNYYDFDIREKEITKMGVDIAVLSLGPPGIDFLEPRRGIELARKVTMNFQLSSIKNQTDILL